MKLFRCDRALTSGCNGDRENTFNFTALSKFFMVLNLDEAIAEASA
ncbi:hypothetical protein H6G17_16865 [Chroococcidiopsis sp. FACHB-1243]|nr:hypothetical protein [Chroococcidiopsis sp. [FACHB-1243]]MBD2307172.1 hypothetical protein [Chroococcidiopsis sp. [FACHB-1243]]